MPLIRLFTNEIISYRKFISLDREKSHYLKNVMRKKGRDKIIIFNENEEWEGNLDFNNGNKILPISLIRKSKKEMDIWLCCSLIKSKNLSYVVEKVSEIGVKKIIPILTDYSERYKPNYSRLKKISIEAVEQSEGMHVPRIEESEELNKLLEKWDSERIIIFCDEARKGEKISKIKIQKKKKIAIFVGPVGGWSENEKKSFKKFNPLNVILGKNILKVDTSCIVSLSAVKNFI